MWYFFEKNNTVPLLRNLIINLMIKIMTKRLLVFDLMIIIALLGVLPNNKQKAV
jgi:hypothetical protein